MQKLFSFFIALFIGFSSIAQLSGEEIQQIDSLKEVISTAKHDTIKIKALIAWDNIIFFSEPELDLALNKQILEICESNLTKKVSGNQKGIYIKNISFSLNNLGIGYSIQGNFEEAISYYRKNLKICKEIGDQKGIIKSYNNMGNIYFEQGNLQMALKIYYKNLNIHEEIGYHKGMAGCFNNIGTIYKKQKNFQQALTYYQKSLKIEKEIDNKQGIANSLENIGILYFDIGNYEQAYESHEKSLNIFKKIGYKRGIAMCLGNIGEIYFAKGNIDEAYFNYNNSLNIFKEIGDKDRCAMTLNYIGILCKDQGELDKALDKCLEALQLAKEIKSLDHLDRVYKSLYEIYKMKGDSYKALEMYELHITSNDSLAMINGKREKYEYELNIEYELLKQADSMSFAKAKETERIQHQADLKEAVNNRNFLYFGIGFLLLLVSVGFLAFFQKKKDHQIIARQKQLVEEKNKDIIDSVNYAKRIQSGVLPPKKVLKQYLEDSFILYLPKDIVAGDFYWMYTINNMVLFAVADCTGHGIPGAMVSVIGNNALNRSVREYGLTDPGKILDRSRAILIQEFERSEEEVKDGMDIALCTLRGNELSFAGANNPLWIIRNGELLETRGDSQPIGRFDQSKPFTTHEFELQKGDTIYIFSDGFADQFGGEKGKKFKKLNFKKLLLSIEDKPIAEHKKIIEETFDSWKGELEQIDDVCVMGVRV